MIVKIFNSDTIQIGRAIKQQTSTKGSVSVAVEFLSGQLAYKTVLENSG